jgi:hypothetical protein
MSGMSRTSTVLRKWVIINMLTSYVTSNSCKYTKLAHTIVSITSAEFVIHINRTSSRLSDNNVLDKERSIGVVSWQFAAADGGHRILCFLLTVHLDIIRVNNQLGAQFFFSICLFQFSTCFEQPRAHHQENQLYQYNIWYVSHCVGDRLVCRSGSSFPTCVLDGKSDTYQMLYWYNWFSWWCVRGCSKHVEKWNKHIEKKVLCVKLVIYKN